MARHHRFGPYPLLCTLYFTSLLPFSHHGDRRNNAKKLITELPIISLNKSRTQTKKNNKSVATLIDEQRKKRVNASIVEEEQRTSGEGN